jgi:predicted nuclease of predicted toxin-antitoxin system
LKRLLLDQGLPAGAATRLRSLGWNAVHEREIGMREAGDFDLLARAEAEDRVMVTLDHDFPKILALTVASRPSVVFIRQQHLRSAGIVTTIGMVWREHEKELDADCVVVVSRRGSRLRPLPLR